MARMTTSIEFKAEPGAQRSSSVMQVMQVAHSIERVLPSKAPLPTQRPLVLIVDDDDELRESLVRMLAECDLEAVGAKSSIDALEILQHSSIDIIVAEQFLWGMDGVSLLSTVRRRWPLVQRVLFTADASPDILLGAVNRAGVHKVLLKTMHAVQIRDEIEAVAIDVLRRP